jgi:predicted alpha/beta-fold hydrolase
MQTVYASYMLPIRLPPYRRIIWTGPNASQIDIDIDVIDGKPGMPTIVLFHGLVGDSQCHYARALAWQCVERGWTFIVPHLSGAKGTLYGEKPSYQDDRHIEWLFRKISLEWPTARLFVVGVSFGALPLLRWLAHHKQAAIALICAIAVVSAPIDLLGTAKMMVSRNFCIYRWYFLWKLLRSVRPGILGSTNYADWFARNLQTIGGATYFEGWSPNNLQTIETRTLLINARNDPCLSEACFPLGTDLPASIFVEYPDEGGHVGFVSGQFPGRFDWLPHRLIDFFNGASMME